jgi:UDPglucose 6-dehydrogenase
MRSTTRSYVQTLNRRAVGKIEFTDIFRFLFCLRVGVHLYYLRHVRNYSFWIDTPLVVRIVFIDTNNLIGMDIEDVSVVGLGKLGACMAGIFANAGYNVTGIDVDEDTVKAINTGEPPVIEPKLAEYVSMAGTNLKATTSVEAVKETDATFIVVNAPIDDSGRYSLDAIEAVCRSLGDQLREIDDHTVVVTSTVFPGSTAGPIREWLEGASGKVVGEEFQLAYSPEFIAIGDVIRGLERPDFFLIGEHTTEAGDRVAQVYRQIRQNDAPMVRMDLTSAEVAKMAINSYITMKISYANTLGQISEEINAEVDAMAEALSADSRINGNYLTAGARFGGPCFPRDNSAFRRLAEDAETAAPLAAATDEVNSAHTEWIADIIRSHTPESGTVAVLGVTYKPGTYIAEESQGSALIESLADDFELTCYDPMGVDHAKTLPAGASYHSELAIALEGADVAVLSVPWEEFTDPRNYNSFNLTLIDPWRTMSAADLSSVSYIPLGRRR